MQAAFAGRNFNKTRQTKEIKMDRTFTEAALAEEEDWLRMEKSLSAQTEDVYVEPHSVKPSHVLRKGAQHMEDRAATYDAPGGERSMGRTVEAFNAIYGHKLTEEEGWQFMSILKKVRANQGDFKLDNYEDDCAYAALAAEAASKSRQKV